MRETQTEEHETIPTNEGQFENRVPKLKMFM